jgi:hypothetical protein
MAKQCRARDILMSQQSRNFRFEQSGNFLRMCAKSLPFPLSDIMLHRGHPSRLPFGAPAGAALTGPDRDAEPLFLIRGNDRLCSGNVRIPEVSTLRRHERHFV